MSKAIEAREKWRVTEARLQAKIEDTEARITAAEGELVRLRGRRESLVKTLWEFQFGLSPGDIIRVEKELFQVENVRAEKLFNVILFVEIRKVLKNGGLSVNTKRVGLEKHEIRRILAAKDVNQYTLKRELLKLKGEE